MSAFIGIKVFTSPIIFNPNNPSDILYTLGMHKKGEENFEYMALLHFYKLGITEYKKVPFDPTGISTIYDELLDPERPGEYKGFDKYCIKVTNINPNDDRPQFSFKAIERPATSPTASAQTAYFPLALFISIMEFYKDEEPGDDIDGYIEFTKGVRVNVNGELDDVILFRFKSKTKGMQFYDYSSEDPRAVKVAIQNLVESQQQ